jgi:hypothetical protein
MWEGVEWDHFFHLDALFSKFDFEKAQYIVEWLLILAILKAPRFGPNFSTIVKPYFLTLQHVSLLIDTRLKAFNYLGTFSKVVP